jgi:hypothetical protein
MRETVRLRHAISRAARLRLGLLDEQGASVQATFVNLLEAPADEGVVVVAGFGEAMAGVAAVVSTSAAPT